MITLPPGAMFINPCLQLQAINPFCLILPVGHFLNLPVVYGDKFDAID